MCTACVLRVHCMRTACALHVHVACALHVHVHCVRKCTPQVTLDHAACLALCSACANCRFTSVSRAHRQQGQNPPRSQLKVPATHHPRGPPACSGLLSGPVKAAFTTWDAEKRLRLRSGPAHGR